MTDTNIKQLLAPVYWNVHRSVQAHTHTHYLLFGGRGSCKSSFVSIEVLLLLLRFPACHALVLRKMGATLRDSVYSQYCWAAQLLGIADKFDKKLSPPELVYRPTGQRILFRGADDKDKIKSLKLPFGYIGITHFEEKDQFDSRAELRTILQTTMRGGESFWNFETCNPPENSRHWANADALLQAPGRLVMRSDYRSVPPGWLGGQFFAEAALLQKQNPAAYRHEYLGLAGGAGAGVFCNVTVRTLAQAETAEMDRLYCGVDWGYFPDPFAANLVHYDAARHTLYIVGEVHAQRMANADTAALLQTQLGIEKTQLIYADSAEPKSIADYRALGLAAKPVHKGAGSVAYSMKWLAGLAAIVIDSACVHTAREFTQYEYDKDRDGMLLPCYPDKDNHHIDAVRYALYPVWRRRGQ